MQSSAGFRLALLTTDGTCPRWMWLPLQAAFTRRLVTLAAVANISGFSRQSHSWIVETYAKWERARYLPPENLMDAVNVDDSGTERVASFGLQEQDQLASWLRGCSANVLLVVPGAEQFELDGIDIPVWRLQFGATERTNCEPGLWEVVERSLTSVSLVEIAPSSSAPRILETIVARTDPRSWVRNQLGLMAKASDLLRRWVPPQFSRIRLTESNVSPVARTQNGTNQHSSLAVLRLLARFGSHAVGLAVNVEQWQLAIHTAGDFGRLQNPEILRPPLDRYWCDPFPLLRDGVLHVFVEECFYESNKGHISLLSRSPSGAWSGPTTVLERPYHLSYPFAFEYDDELLLLPETISAGRVELYRCVQFPCQWELDTVLIDNVAGVDPTLWFQDDRWWLFLDVADELCLFYSDSPRGPWEPHPGNPVKSDSRNSRPAGRIFRLDGDVIRPSQDCSLQYGRQVVFNKITRLTVRNFEEVEICRLQTPWNGNITCCHTYNQCDDITVVDCLVRRRK